MKKQVTKKLVVTKRTIVNLDNHELIAVKGGGASEFRPTNCCTLIPKTCSCAC